jgi:hypothetical protein
MYGEKRVVYIVFVGNPEGNRRLGRHKLIRIVNIQMGFWRYNGRSWTGLSWLRVGAGGGNF